MDNKKQVVKPRLHKKPYAKKDGQAITTKRRKPLPLDIIILGALFYGSWLVVNDIKK